MLGKLLGGRYEILEQIGDGGMATVYKAKCRLLNRFVAIKVLKDEFASDDEFVKKFRRESQAAASLSHPNIVNIYDVGTDENEDKLIHYIVMEYIKGRTLKEVIKDKGHLSEKETIDYALQIGSAIEDAHNNNIIHRDIKPQNIMIDENGRIKVMDFGIARAATSSTITTTSEALGSVHYFSPEQARGGYTDEKSDIYSLGIVMYEMATGEIPYQGESPITVALKHVQEDITPPSHIKGSLSKGLEDVILKCVNKRQIDRYSNMGLVIQDLKNIKLNEVKDLEKNSLEEEDLDSHTRVIPILKEEDLKKPVDMEDLPSEEVLSKKKKKPKKDKSKGNKGIFLGVLMAFILTSAVFFGKNKFKQALSSKEIIMPDLLNETEEAAKTIIDELGLKFNAKKVPSKDHLPGIVIDQSEAAGTKLKRGYPIEVKISEAVIEQEGNSIVPNLEGRSVSEAQYLLRDLSLGIDVNYVDSDLVELDRIIDQSLTPGTEVSKGTVVRVNVSQGNSTSKIIMPKLVGFKLEEAKEIIKESNLKLSAIEEDSDAPKGVVTWQSHNTGTELEKNTIVNIKVSNGKPIKEEPEESKPEETDNPKENPVKLTILVTQDNTEVKVIRTQDGNAETIYNKMENAGEVVISTSGFDGAKFDIYVNGNLIDTVQR